MSGREILESGGIEPNYLETEAGHWLPPETIEPARRLVKDALAL